MSGEPACHPKLQPARYLVKARGRRSIAAPAEVSEAMVWLCSDAASFITGLPMAVAGGWVAQ